MQSYEEELGFKLFERSHTGVVLTKAGENLYQIVKKILAEYDAAVEQSAKIAASPVAIRAAFTVLAINALSLKNLLAFNEFQTNARLEIISLKTEIACEMLQNGDVDFICTLHPTNEYHFISRRILSGKPYLLLPSTSPLSQKEEISFKDLANCTLMHTSGLAQLFSKRYDTSGIKFQYFSNNPELICNAILSGIGVYLIPERTLHSFTAPGITAVPLEPGIIDLDLYLSYQETSKQAPIIRQFEEFIGHITEIM